MFTDIRRLRAFLVVAEEMSFTAAAERLNMAQPWVSVQVRQLEENLNLRLFVRNKGTSVTLTPEGEELFTIARGVIDRLMGATNDIRNIQRGSSSRVTLGVDPITLYIPDRNKLIASFISEANKTNLNVVSRTPADLFAGLAARDLDLILTSIAAPDATIEVLPLYEYELQLAIPKSRSDLLAKPIAQWDHAKMLTLPDNYHPSVIHRLKNALDPDHVEWIECPENSYHALIKYSLLLGIPTLSPDFGESIPELGTEVLLRPAADPPLKVSWGLMRLHGSQSRAAEGFWRFAEKMAAAGPT